MVSKESSLKLTPRQVNVIEKLRRFIVEDDELLCFFTTVGSGKSYILDKLERSFEEVEHPKDCKVHPVNPYLRRI